MSPSRSSEAVTMTPLQGAVYRELQAICGLPLIGATGDGWVRAFHVRYFRGCDTEPEILKLTLEGVDSRLRSLSRRGLIEKRQGRSEYRLARSR